MQKYLAIINTRTVWILLICVVITWGCIEFDFSFDLNITLFSVAVIFPLVFTIRQSFRRRDEVIKLLSVFKASLNAVYLSFANLPKLDEAKKDYVAECLQEISTLFLDALKGGRFDAGTVRRKFIAISDLVRANRDYISTSSALKIIRFLRDTEESLENTVGIKNHGSPISLRAYCLVFIFVFPFIFIPTVVYQLQNGDAWVIYSLSLIHGFVLISLYNVQDQMENPFDQIGLDDIQLEEFHFRNMHEKVSVSATRDADNLIT